MNILKCRYLREYLFAVGMTSISPCTLERFKDKRANRFWIYSIRVSNTTAFNYTDLLNNTRLFKYMYSMKWMLLYYCSHARYVIVLQIIQVGNLELLVWFCDIYGIPSDIISYAARCGQLEILKWLCKYNVPLSFSILEQSVTSGNLSVVQWVYENITVPRDRYIETRILDQYKYNYKEITDWLETMITHVSDNYNINR